MEKLKILQIVPSLSLSNGVAAYLENYYKNMDLTKFETTILVLNDDNKGRYEAFKALGCKIIEFYKSESFGKYLKKVDKLFKDNQFDIIHCHTPNYGAFFMHYAKKHGVISRILHSHANKYADTKINAIRNFPLFKFAVLNSNKYLACSKIAGDFLFKKREYLVINNAIELLAFKFDLNKREKLRNELKLEDKYVIGEFGRLCPQKNQLFTIDIFYEIYKKKEDARLLLIGDGALENDIRKKVSEYGLEEKVIILNSKSNICDYYNCLDMFLLPSTYEGLGIVLIEAQANSLPCYTSLDRVPKLAKISPLLKYLDLNDGASKWADCIMNDNDNVRKDYYEEILNSDFNIKNEAKKLEEFYISSVNA